MAKTGGTFLYWIRALTHSVNVLSLWISMYLLNNALLSDFKIPDVISGRQKDDVTW